MTLADRIARVLALSDEPMAAQQVARVVRTREGEVRDALRLDARFVETATPHGARFTLASTASDARASSPARYRGILAGSQNHRILRVLGDGDWHTTAEIHRRAGFSRLNSRVAELRSRGFVIECERVSGESGARGYAYRLVGGGNGGDGPGGQRVSTTRESVPSDQLSFGAAA